MVDWWHEVAYEDGKFTIKGLLNGILSDRTGKSLDIVTRDTDRDYFMSAEEALKYGIVDSIIPHRAI